LTGDVDYERAYGDMSDAQIDEAMWHQHEMDLTQPKALSRLRRLERKLGLPHHKVVFEPDRKICDEKGNPLDAQIPKPGERFYEKTNGKFRRVEREVGVIYVYTGSPGMPLIRCLIHECVEKLEDERDRPAVEAINRSFNLLNDLVEQIIKRHDSPSDLVKIAIAKRDEAKRDARRLSEEIYRRREKVVERLVSRLIRETPITLNEEYERGEKLFNEVYPGEGKPPRKRKLTKKEEELLSQFIQDCMIDYEYPE